MRIDLFYGIRVPFMACRRLTRRIQKVILRFLQNDSMTNLRLLIDHSFLTYKKELLEYGYKVGKISMKEQTVDFERVQSA